MINKTVVIAAIIVGGVGFVRVWSGGNAQGPSGTTAPTNITRILLGAYVVMLVLAGVDSFMPQSRPLVNAFSILIATTAVFMSGLLTFLSSLFNAPGGSSGTSKVH
jgi:hypothetical protein